MWRGSLVRNGLRGDRSLLRNQLARFCVTIWTNTVNGVLGGPGLIGPEPTKAAGDAAVWKILKFRTKFAMGRRVHGTVHTGSFGTLNAGMENWIVRAHIGGE